MRIPRRASVAAAMAILVFAAPMGAAYALWTATSTATVDVTIAAPAPSAPPSPTSFRCTATTNNSISIAWAPAPGAANGYRVYRRTGSAPPYTYSTTFAGASAGSTSLSSIHRSAWDIPMNTPSTLVIRSVGENQQESVDSGIVAVTFNNSGGTCSPLVSP